MPDSTDQPRHATLRDYCVIYFGNDWFAENRTSSHHIARRLAAVVPVLYIEMPGSRAPQSNVRDLRKLWRKLMAAFAPPRRIHETLSVKTIPQIPFRKLPLMNLINRVASQWLMRREVKRAGFRRLISWFVVPHPGALARRLGEDLTVYYCIDDYAAHPGMDPIAIQALDDHLTRSADIVFVAPTGLMDAKRALNADVRYSPHGVDFDLFARAADPATKIPEAARAFGRPVVGYFGTIGEWMDFGLVTFLARSRPDWTFLFIGYAAADASVLRSLPNVVLTGSRPYEELPQWAAAFDVAINPHRVTRQVKNANSLKIREYLATGKPVVSVTTPETANFADVVALADTPEDFLAAIERVLAEDCEDLRRKRMDRVRPLSWDARFDATVRAIDDLLREKK
jgi:glycosyltransferase involved in cell wall biosynthesis